MAAALCESLTENGVRVPEDICVTGYDGSWDAWMHFPRITTITGRDRQFGEDAVLRLVTVSHRLDSMSLSEAAFCITV